MSALWPRARSARPRPRATSGAWWRWWVAGRAVGALEGEARCQASHRVWPPPPPLLAGVGVGAEWPNPSPVFPSRPLHPPPGSAGSAPARTGRDAPRHQARKLSAHRRNRRRGAQGGRAPLPRRLGRQLRRCRRGVACDSDSGCGCSCDPPAFVLLLPAPAARPPSLPSHPLTHHPPTQACDFGLSDFFKPDQRFSALIGSAYYVVGSGLALLRRGGGGRRWLAGWCLSCVCCLMWRGFPLLKQAGKRPGAA